MDEHKNQSNQSGAKPNPQGSGSDAVSAAKNPASAVGQSLKPGEGFSGSGAQRSGSDAASAAAMSSGGGSSPAPQSPTLASHTSRPLGGSSDAGQSAHTMGSSAHAASSSAHSAAQGARDTAQSMADAARQTAQGAAETARQTAQSVGETARQTADQVQRRAGEAYEQASDVARDTYEQASSWASDQYENASRNLDNASRRAMQGMERAQHGVERFIHENPVLVGVMGLAAGLVIGALLPRTRQEDRAFGRWADEVREQGVRYARDMTQRGREYVEEAFSDDDARFATHENERRGDGPRPGGPGRYQNH